MQLLVLSLAYLIGITVGRLLWAQTLIGCDTPSWLWIPTLLPIPLLLWWDRRRDGYHTDVAAPMRWPISAGFEVPRPFVTAPLIAAILLAAMAGLLRFASHPLDPCWTPADLAFYNAAADAGAADPVVITGFVSNYSTVNDGQQRLHVEAEQIEIDGIAHAVSGQLRLSTSPRQRYSYGQPLRVAGLLQDPPRFEDFDYRAYLARKGVHSVIQRPVVEVLSGSNRGSPLLRGIYAIRARGETLINRLLPEPHAALANGMLLGVEAGIPNDLYDQFNLTGTSHVIVISGSNVAIVSGVLMALGVRVLGRRRALLPTLVGIGVYAFLVGGDAAVVRAALMGGLFVVATVIERRNTALISLAVACWAMTVLNPLTLWDVGFQLSAAATAGLILFSPGLTAALDRLWPGLGQGGHLTGNGGVGEAGTSLLRGLLQDGLLITIAANLTTLPLVVYYFDRLSIISPVTNVLIAPVQSFIMLGGGAGVIVGLMGLSLLARVLLWIPYVSLLWTVWMVEWTAALPGASITIAEYGLGALATTYTLLAVMRWRNWLRAQVQILWQATQSLVGSARSTALRSTAKTVSSKTVSSNTAVVSFLGKGDVRWGRLVNTTTLAGVAVAAFLVWRALLSQPDGRLHVYFLDIGQGDGVFVQTPSGRQLLIDGGSDPQRLFAELGNVMPFWDRSLDLLLLSHPDFDHMGAQLNVLERYTVEQAVVSAVTLDHEDGKAWKDAMAAANVPVTVQGAGGWIDLGDGVALWFLWPPDEESVRLGGIAGDDKNERSLVAMLVYGDLHLLLTGDAGLPTEQALVRADAPLGAQVLKIGHHGSNSSTGADFVSVVNPSVAVIQVGENRYGHPHAEVMSVLAGRLILRNDEHGWIHVWSDGTQMWMAAERGVDLRSFDR